MGCHVHPLSINSCVCNKLSKISHDNFLIAILYTGEPSVCRKSEICHTKITFRENESTDNFIDDTPLFHTL